MTAGGAERLSPEAKGAWWVPLSVLVAVLVGSATAGLVQHAVNPSGSVQDPLRTPVPQLLDTGVVSDLFGAPLAALFAALVSYFGRGRPRPWAFGLVGMTGGVGLSTIVGFLSLPLGAWWVDSGPTDTNQAAALFALMLAPAGTLALALAATAPAEARQGSRVARLGFHLALGVVLGIVLGCFVAGAAASLTWAIHCPQNGYSRCFSLSSVLSSAFLLGAIVGVGTGAVVGFVSWLLSSRRTTGGPEPGQVPPD